MSIFTYGMKKGAERLAAATLDFYHRFMQRPDAKELLERKKAELRARGVRLN